VIEPPDDSYVLVNGAGPCGASDVELLLDDELEELLEVVLDDVLEAGGTVGDDCPPTVTGGGATAVDAGNLDDGGEVLTDGAAVVEIRGTELCTDVEGAGATLGAAVVDGTADVWGAIELDGSVAGATLSSPLPPLSRRTPAPITASKVASPEMPARRRRMPRARARTASWAWAVPRWSAAMSGALRWSAAARSSSNGSKSVIIALPRAAA
jgi:hypothetical protein